MRGESRCADEATLDDERSRSDQVLLLECNIDDMTGEELGFALQTILDAGALDAWFAPIYMKKNRPATLLSVLVRTEQGASMRRLLLRGTSTLGVRWRNLDREIAERRTETVSTPWGDIFCKLKVLGGRVVSAKPEYDDCARIARQHELPLARVVGACRAACEGLVTTGAPES